MGPPSISGSIAEIFVLTRLNLDQPAFANGLILLEELDRREIAGPPCMHLPPAIQALLSAVAAQHIGFNA